MTLAASSGKLDVFQSWSIAGAQITPRVCETAAAAPCDELLRWLIEHQQYEDTRTLCTFAARAGRLKNLRYLKEAVMLPWDAYPLLVAAIYGASANGTDTEAVIEYVLSQQNKTLIYVLPLLIEKCLSDPKASNALYQLQKYEAKLKAKQHNVQQNA